jgi:DNA-binding Xre family transcriptional regulator
MSAKLKNQIGVILIDQPMALKELAEEMELTEKRVYKLLSSMYKGERVTAFKDLDGVRRYRVTEDEAEKAEKRKARAEKKAAKGK